jgi:DNA repair protein RadC
MKTHTEKPPHYLGHRKRIKERFLKTDIAALKDYEILELLLTFAIPQKDVKPLAKELLAQFQSFQGVLDAPFDDLIEQKGIGTHTAILLKLTRACSDFYLRQQLFKKSVISSPDDLLQYCMSAMAGLGEEQFRVIYLNAKNEVITDDVAQEGTVDQAAIYPRKIMERALRQKAVSLIFVHNHPSGNPLPSSHDKALTRKLIQAASALSVKVHDHVIIGRNGYFSFREEGLLDR